jgi:hypothetical protein
MWHRNLGLSPPHLLSGGDEPITAWSGVGKVGVAGRQRLLLGSNLREFCRRILVTFLLLESEYFREDGEGKVQVWRTALSLSVPKDSIGWAQDGPGGCLHSHSFTVMQAEAMAEDQGCQKGNKASGGVATHFGGWWRSGGPIAATPRLGVLIPEAQLPLGHVEVEAVTLLATADATLIGRGPITAVAVLEHAGVPGQTQAVTTGTGFPTVPSLPTVRQLHLLGGLGHRFKHRAVHTWVRERQGKKGRKHS